MSVKSSVKQIQTQIAFHKNSWAGLRICQAMLEAIMYKHSIMSELPEIVRCFRDKICDVEDAFGGALCKRCMLHINGLYPFRGSVSSEADKAPRVFIRLRYPENNGRRLKIGIMMYSPDYGILKLWLDYEDINLASP